MDTAAADARTHHPCVQRGVLRMPLKEERLRSISESSGGEKRGDGESAANKRSNTHFTVRIMTTSVISNEQHSTYFYFCFVFCFLMYKANCCFFFALGGATTNSFDVESFSVSPSTPMQVEV